MHSTDAMKGVGARLEGSTIQGHYYIEKLVQRGGMAWLYKARHKILQEPMAIKILFPQWSDDPLVRVRFIDEAKIQFKLKHPNIVQVTDVIEDAGLLGIVQEWVDGEDLSHFIQRIERPLTLEEIWIIAEPLLSALEFAHEMGVVHRDIKPSNVLLGYIGDRISPKLADFGIAKILDELGERTTTGTTLGTMKYIAPEQIRDSKSVDHRADIYGFGVMLYRMATGHYPFSGKIESVMFKQLYEPPPRPRELNPELDPGFEEVILQCLTKHPEDRFPDCQEVLESLRPLMPTRQKRHSRSNPLFAEFSQRQLQNDSFSYDPQELSLEDSSPDTGHAIPSRELSELPSSDPNAELAFAEHSTPGFHHSIETLKSLHQDVLAHSQTPLYDSAIEPHFANQAPYSPPPQAPHLNSSPFQPQRPLSHPPGPYHPSSGASPFSPPEDSPWGEFMLETEDEYEIDDDPTEAPQTNPFANSMPVEVRLGSGTTGSYVPFPSEELELPALDPPPVAPANSSGSSTMLEAAPSLAQLANAAPPAGSPMSAAMSSPVLAPISPPMAQPITPDQPEPEVKSLIRDTAPFSVEMVERLAHFDSSSPSSTTLSALVDGSPISSASLPSRLEGSGIFSIQITPSNPSLDAALPLPVTREPAPSLRDRDSQSQMQAPSESQIRAQASSDSQMQPLGSSDFESWQSTQRAAPPLYFYPIIGIVLGLIVLGAAWMIMRLKKESAQQSTTSHSTRRLAPKRQPVARIRSAAPQADLFAGCKKQWPADKQPHRLDLSIEPNEMFAVHHPKFRDYVKGSICLEYFQSPTITLSRSGYSDCSITLPIKQKTLRIHLKKSVGTEKRDKHYCMTP